MELDGPFRQMTLLPEEVRLGELASGRHSQLRVDLAEVVLDGPTAEEQLGRDVGVAVAVAGVLSDLELLRRQVLRAAEVAPDGALAGGAQLVTGSVRPRSS